MLPRALILVLDNRDSFTFNLKAALETLGAGVTVRRASTLSMADVERLNPKRILIGPGPGHARDALLSLEILRASRGHIPILGVCLGYQALAVAFGGRIKRARELVHGRTVKVLHDAAGVFHGLPSPLEMMRYNSLAVEEESLPACLAVSARDPAGEILGLRHSEWRLEGVQFHPESILSERGLDLLENFVS